ncbi:hypothetical protein ACMFMG_000916 [Clarireedia jacksonii]
MTMIDQGIKDSAKFQNQDNHADSIAMWKYMYKRPDIQPLDNKIPANQWPVRTAVRFSPTCPWVDLHNDKE